MKCEYKISKMKYILIEAVKELKAFTFSTKFMQLYLIFIITVYIQIKDYDL